MREQKGRPRSNGAISQEYRSKHNHGSPLCCFARRPPTLATSGRPPPGGGGGGGRVRLSGQQSASAGGSVNSSRRCQKGQRAQTCQEAAEPLSAVRDRKLEEEVWEQLQPGSRKAAEPRSSQRSQHSQHATSTCSFKKDYCLTPNNNNNHSVLHSGSSAIVCVVMGTAAYSFDM